jgi:CspA family cold shock protein
MFPWRATLRSTSGWRPESNRGPDGINPSNHSGNAQMAEGTIKKLMDKGFGFIKTGTDKDLFFHSSSLVGVSFDELHEGQKVSYTEGRGPKGPCAENVKPN